MKKLILLVLAVILIVSVSAQTCTECQAIDQAWQDLFSLVNIKNEFYNPPTNSWQLYSTNLGQTPPPVLPQPGTEDFEQYRSTLLNDIKNAINNENSYLTILKAVSPKTTQSKSRVMLILEGNASIGTSGLIGEEKEFLKNIESRLYSVKNEQADEIRKLEIFTYTPTFINFLNNTKNSINLAQTNTAFVNNLNALTNQLTDMISKKNNSYRELDISPQCTAAQGSCTSAQTCSYLEGMVLTGKDCPSTKPVCCKLQ